MKFERPIGHPISLDFYPFDTVTQNSLLPTVPMGKER